MRVQNFLATPRQLEPFLWTAVGACARGFGLQTVRAREVALLATATLLFYYGLSESSRWYHMIRGQSHLKLYVLYNVLEVGDRLCTSLGLDILEAVGELPSFQFVIYVVAMGYVLVHSVVLYVQILTLNVAINSNSQTLLSLLVSNQFVELKSSVFKKFDVDSLFQLSCAGMCVCVELMFGRRGGEIPAGRVLAGDLDAQCELPGGVRGVKVDAHGRGGDCGERIGRRLAEACVHWQVQPHRRRRLSGLWAHRSHRCARA